MVAPKVTLLTLTVTHPHLTLTLTLTLTLIIIFFTLTIASTTLRGTVTAATCKAHMMPRATTHARGTKPQRSTARDAGRSRGWPGRAPTGAHPRRGLPPRFRRPARARFEAFLWLLSFILRRFRKSKAQKKLRES